MSNDKTRYPLSWPDRWPRTDRAKITWSRFKDHSMAAGIDKLQTELNRLGATDAILSTNIPLTLHGVPRSNTAKPSDMGVAVYFKWKKRDVSLACDRWNSVEQNLWAIACHIETLRSQERWGVGSLEQAFRGYIAIPQTTGGASWWVVLGVAVNATADQVNDAYKAKVKIYHPDIPGTGDAQKFNEVQEAYRQAVQVVRGGAE